MQTQNLIWPYGLLSILFLAIIVCINNQITLVLDHSNILLLNISILVTTAISALIIQLVSFLPIKRWRLLKLNIYNLIFLGISVILGFSKCWIMLLSPDLPMLTQDVSFFGILILEIITGSFDLIFLFIGGYYISKLFMPINEIAAFSKKEAMGEIFSLFLIAMLCVAYFATITSLMTNNTTLIESPELLYFLALIHYAVCGFILFRKKIIFALKNTDKLKANPQLMTLGIIMLALALGKYLLNIRTGMLQFPLGLIRVGALWQVIYMFAGIYYIILSFQPKASGDKGTALFSI